MHVRRPVLYAWEDFDADDNSTLGLSTHLPWCPSLSNISQADSCSELYVHIPWCPSWPQHMLCSGQAMHIGGVVLQGAGEDNSLLRGSSLMFG